MYEVTWDKETGGIILGCNSDEAIKLEIRPVFYEELDLLGFNKYWTYPKCQEPLLWATSVSRRYFYKGQFVAEVKGGGFFEQPVVEVFEKNLELQPVRVPDMIKKNSAIIDGMAQSSIKFILKTHEAYQKKTDITAVAFSGGKDSLVLLDLVQRTLPPNEFVVVFNDTSMEISATLEAVEKAKQRWNNLSFHTAKAHKDATVTWEEFGPPSRIQRWCCTVHKSAPTLLCLRKIAGKPSIKALVFDGIRWAESQSRSGYKAITDGGKHSSQINASPVLTWGAHEIFIYLFQRNIFLNDAYRYGLVRVGCGVCPFGSKLSETIYNKVFYKDIQNFLTLLKLYAYDRKIDENKITQFIDDGRWKSRAGGMDLAKGENKLYEFSRDNSIFFSITNPNENWFEWIKTIGNIVRYGKKKGDIQGIDFILNFRIVEEKNRIEVKIIGTDRVDRFVISNIRAVNYKTAYCMRCKACEVECPTGALKIETSVSVDETKCIHCAKCLSFMEKGCLAAKSLSITKKGIEMKGLNRYQTFGMRKEWLKEFFTKQELWWNTKECGNRQFDAMKVWLKESELIDKDKLSSLCLKLRIFGTDSVLCWGVIWTNLCRNSALINWYLSTIAWKNVYKKKDLIALIEGNLSQRTRQNSITSLVSILKDTPLGNEMGLGKVTDVIDKQGWTNPHPLAVLYSLYRYAEKIGSYRFTLSELYNQAPEGPYLLFGIPEDELTRILRGLASRYEKWISVELVRDLDNIYLDSNKKSAETLDLE